MAEEKTVLEGSELDEPNEKKTTKKKTAPKKSGSDISSEECQQKLARLFNAFAVFAKSKRKYKENEFADEAKDLARMAQKYPIIDVIIKLLDPLFFLLGIVSKFGEVMNERVEKKEAKKEGQATT